MTYGSLFSGAGGFDMGFDAAGLTCLWQCEIDRTARSVLARHWPDVERHEDVCKAGKRNLPRVDILAGGFPCQGLSLAGKRAGLMGDERSGLWWEMLRVIRETEPGLVVFENVPGLRSNDSGRDYARVVCSLAEHGYFGCVRTLDARNFGVPQSRPRLFGVFARGPDGAERACEILAVREGLPWNLEARRQEEAEVAGTVAGCSGAAGWRIGPDEACAGHVVFGGNDTRGERRGDAALNTKGGNRQDFETENIVYQCHGSNVGPFGTHRAGNGNATGGVPFVYRTAGDGNVYEAGDKTAPLTTSTDPCTQIVLSCLAGDGIPKGNDGSISYALTARKGRGHGHGHAVCISGDHTHALTSVGFDASEDGTGRGTPIVARAGELRRLTPRETERLMDWPDDWTRYRADGSEISDGPRYRMTGNGVVRRVAHWIGWRIVGVS